MKFEIAYAFQEEIVSVKNQSGFLWSFDMSSLLPENVSSYGSRIDYLFDLVYYIVTPWTILTFTAILLSCILFWRYWREEEGQYFDGHETAFSFLGMDVPATILVLEIPTLTVLVLDLWIFGASLSVWQDIKIDQPENIQYQAEVTGKQFTWTFEYPGPDGELQTDDDESAFELHVPAGEPMQVVLTSEDVLHSFFVPNLRVKQDVVPGRRLKEWFKVSEDKLWAYFRDESLRNSKYVLDKLENDEGKIKEVRRRIREIRNTMKQEKSESTTVTKTVKKKASKSLSLLDASSLSRDQKFEVIDNISKVKNIARGLLDPKKGIPMTIACAELCGTGHTSMMGSIKIHRTEDGFLKWREENLDY